jgi:hypothetical protein
MQDVKRFSDDDALCARIIAKRNRRNRKQKGDAVQSVAHARRQ